MQIADLPPSDLAQFTEFMDFFLLKNLMPIGVLVSSEWKDFGLASLLFLNFYFYDFFFSKLKVRGHMDWK